MGLYCNFNTIVLTLYHNYPSVGLCLSYDRTNLYYHLLMFCNYCVYIPRHICYAALFVFCACLALICRALAIHCLSFGICVFVCTCSPMLICNDVGYWRYFESTCAQISQPLFYLSTTGATHSYLRCRRARQPEQQVLPISLQLKLQRPQQLNSPCAATSCWSSSKACLLAHTLSRLQASHGYLPHHPVMIAN